MSCCKAEEFKWCAGKPIVYTDEQERGYCVFHAPAGKKGSSSKEFEEKVFSRIRPGQRCDLSGTVFEDISFRRFDEHNPLPEIIFYNATFSGNADFSRVAFSERASFWKATFSENVSFFETTFRGDANFYDATFSGEADFIVATFSGDADFSEVKFNGEASFWKAKFSGKPVFHGKTFLKGGLLTDISINEKIRFDGVDFTKVSFMDTDLRKMDFIGGCIWPKKKGHDVLYDEIEMYEGLKSKGWYGRFKAFLYPADEKLGKVETLYRRLKQKYKEEHDEQRASHWHFCEKEMFRKRNLRRRFIGLTALYGLSSGYGEFPGRASLFLLLLILASSFFQGLFGVVPFSGEPIYGIEGINGFFDMDYRDYEALVALVLNTIQYATFQKVTVFKPASLWGDVIKSLTQVALPVQAALFALAVRNRLRR